MYIYITTNNRRYYEKNQRKEFRVDSKRQLRQVFSKQPVLLNACKAESVLDLSSTGIKVKASNFNSDIGSKITITMVLNERPIRTKGIIKFYKNGEYGIEFLRMLKTDKKFIEDLKISSVIWR